MTRMIYEAHGKAMTLQEWGEVLGVKWKTLWARIDSGIPIQEALTKTLEKRVLPRNPDKTVRMSCAHCGKEYVVPKCREWRERCCSSECKIGKRRADKAMRDQSRQRGCVNCGSTFIATKWQIERTGAKYCSRTCSMAHATTPSLSKEEVRKRRVESIALAIKEGRRKFLKGQENKQWTGGPKAAARRSIESGKAAACTRKYRAKNPERVREWAQKRAQGRIGRLPWGTTQRLLSLQKGKCAICRCSIAHGYHIDHVMPLALGGKHEPSNLQLLCPPCNLRKSAKHPVDYMQEAGFLL